MLKVRSVSRRSHYITLDSGDEVEVMFEPCDWMGIHVEQVGTNLVVAYNVHDSDPTNPMENGDCNGDIYTKSTRYGGGVITDNDSEFYSALCVDSYGGVDRDQKCTIDGNVATLAEHAATQFLRDEGGLFLTEEWCDENPEHGYDVKDEDLSINLYDNIWADLADGSFKYEEIDKLIVELFKQNWREIVGPYVVPLDYCDSNHGPGTTSCHVTDWDGDPDDLPTGVWVACRCAIENIDSSALPEGVDISWQGALGSKSEPLHAVVSKLGVDVHDAGSESGSWGRALKWAKEQFGESTPATVAERAEAYAKAIVEEYAEWCNGNVYGCVVETFENVGTEDDPEWEQTHEEACWGFIGSEYAEQTLKDEFFKSALAGVQPE